MIYRQLGQSGIDVSVIGLGTWAIGGTWWGGTDEKDSIAAIQYGLDNGINLIDTAPVYGYGLAETIVGQAIKGYDRDKVVVATKVGLIWHEEAKVPFFESEGVKVYRNLKPEKIRYEIEQSLLRLDVDYIDLYQTHWQDPKTPIADTMAELLKLKDEGKIRAIGVSNASTNQMEQYLEVGRIESTQPLYNMLDRMTEEDLPFCIEHMIGVLTYSTLGMGLLTGKMDPNRQFPTGDTRAGRPQFAFEPIAKINTMLEQFAPFREKYGLTQTQLTASWTISRHGVTSALVGVRSIEQAAEIIPAGDVVLEESDLAAMDAIIVAAELQP
jgi:aryl-alcohol dehydrogenase-like predicted oxidoreductase